jgi:heme/copper-type cytochrome/quinol oxidase subunit 2
MSVCSISRVMLLIIVATAAVLMLSASAFAQCSMCRAALAGSNNALFIRNFNIGVLVLLVPPVTIFCSIFVVLKRYRAADQEEQSEQSGVENSSVDSKPKTRDS